MTPWGISPQPWTVWEPHGIYSGQMGQDNGDPAGGWEQGILRL